MDGATASSARLRRASVWRSSASAPILLPSPAHSHTDLPHRHDAGVSGRGFIARHIPSLGVSLQLPSGEAVTDAEMFSCAEFLALGNDSFGAPIEGVLGGKQQRGDG